MEMYDIQCRIYSYTTNTHDLRMRRVKSFCVNSSNSILECLNFSTQNRQRRSQFVGNIGYPLLPAFLIVFEGQGECIEITG